jgi:citrate synthase
MASLKQKLAQQIPAHRDNVRSLMKEHGSKVVSQVTLQQAYGGMRYPYSKAN